MHDVLTMKVSNALEGLDEEFECLWFRETILTILMAKQITIIRIFHYHIDAIIFQKSIPKFNNLRVVQPIVKSDLSLHQFDLTLRRHLVEINLYKDS